MRREADALEAEADALASRVREVDFDVVAQGYLAAAARDAADAPARRPRADRGGAGAQEGGAGDGRDPRIATAPGASVQSTLRGVQLAQGARSSFRQALAVEFATLVDKAPPPMVARPADRCPRCRTDMLLQAAKAALVCVSCGHSVAYIDSTMASLSYSDDCDLSAFSYKRSTHFEECMKQVQGKETYVVPDAIVAAAMEELHRQRVTDVAQITQQRVRQVLKALRLRKAYDHVAQVTARITGRPQPCITPAMEERCRRMFHTMQPAFDANCPSTRKNFLSYNYVLFRFFHLIGLRHMLPRFVLLKGKDKLLVADQLFEKICRTLHWPFTPIDQVFAEMAAYARERGAPPDAPA
jgi:hypothetical protein